MGLVRGAVVLEAGSWKEKEKEEGGGFWLGTGLGRGRGVASFMVLMVVVSGVRGFVRGSVFF